MKLPGVENATVGETKIVRYLLSTTDRAGKSKAAFLWSLVSRPTAGKISIGRLGNTRLTTKFPSKKEPVLELDTSLTGFCSAQQTHVERPHCLVY
jgi:hypothetical protein